jgi:hypothetical protein
MRCRVWRPSYERSSSTATTHEWWRSSGARSLGWEVQEYEGAYSMSESGGPGFEQVPAGKSVKNRIHLDVSPVGCDRDDEVARLRRPGAQPVD